MALVCTLPETRHYIFCSRALKGLTDDETTEFTRILRFVDGKGTCHMSKLIDGWQLKSSRMAFGIKYADSAPSTKYDPSTLID